MGGCAARHRHARLGVDDARLQRAPAGPRDRRRRRWREMWLERLRRDAALDRGLALAPAARRVLEAGLGVRRLRRAAVPVYMVGGWDDAYRTRSRASSRATAVPRKGLIGPWSHNYPEAARPARRSASCRRRCAGGTTGSRAIARRGSWTSRAAGLDAGAGRPAPRHAHATGPLDHGARRGRRRRSRWRRSRSARAARRADAGRCSPALRRALRRTAPTPATGARAARPPTSRPTSASEDGRSLSLDSDPLSERLELLGPPRRGARADGRQAARAGRRAALRRRTRRLVAAARTRLPQPHPPRLARASRVRSGRRAHDRARASSPPWGRRSPPGHRLRLSIAPGYWPWIWPSPEPVELTLHTAGESRLELPVRP